MPSKPQRANTRSKSKFTPKKKSTTTKKVPSRPSTGTKKRVGSQVAETKTKTKTKTKKTKPSSQPIPQKVSGETLKIGESAPAFSLPDDTGKIVHSSDLRGKKVIVYFYPKDDTPGCTTEACAFRDGIQQLQSKGAIVFGVSADTVSSHRKFSDKFQLNFPLLSDESKAMIQAYGVWKEKSMYGRTYLGIERTTVIIDEEGKVRKIFPKVKVNEHFMEVLQALG